MAIKERKRELSSGLVSLYLDIHHGGKRACKFYPDLKYKIRPKNKEEKEHKKFVLQIFRERKNELEKELLEGKYGVNTFKNDITNFTDYFKRFLDDYNYKDKRSYEAVFSKIKLFFDKDQILFSDITPTTMQKFIFFLESKLNGVTVNTRQTDPLPPRQCDPLRMSL
jgi:hypothetical protein